MAKVLARAFFFVGCVVGSGLYQFPEFFSGVATLAKTHFQQRDLIVTSQNVIEFKVNVVFIICL